MYQQRHWDLCVRDFSLTTSELGIDLIIYLYPIQDLKGQCPGCAHALALASVFSSKDNRTVILIRQDFLVPDRTADGDLLFTFSSNILDFRRSFSSYLKFGTRLIAILLLVGPPCDPKISFRSLLKQFF